MSDVLNSTTGTTTRSARPEFFCTSGPLSPERPGYVRRSADDQLETGIASGACLNVVGAPQSGKSSLLLRVADQLRNADEPPLVAFIDLNQLAQRDGYQDAARWFYAIAFRLARQLRVTFDLQSWWSENALLGHHHRFFELFREFTLTFPGRRIVLLFDDVHEVLALDAGGQLLSSFRAAFDARATDPDMSRLSIVFAGNGDGQFMPRNDLNLPYAIATRIVLGNFTLGETLRLAPALGLSRDVAELAMQRIHDWVAGQPSTTQYLAAQLARSGVETDVVEAIDRIVRQRFELQRDRQAHGALLASEAMVLSAPAEVREQMLITVGRAAKQQRLLLDPESAAHDRLLRAGVLAVSPDGYLIPCSRLSRRFFNAGWANQHLPMKYSGLIKAAAILLLLTGMPLWYRQYLPQPYVAQMTSPVAGIEQLMDGYERLARWPGYADDARRIALSRIGALAAAAPDEPSLDAVLAPLAEPLGAPAIADALRADFWLRQLALAEQRGDRAGAIHAALQATVRDNLKTRRRLASLISTDLPDLTGVLNAGEPFDELRYRPRDGVLMTLSGSRVDEWKSGAPRTPLERVRSLAPQALTAQAMVTRLTLPATRRPASLVLSFSLQHERVSDVELTITNPAGRSATLNLGVAGLQTGNNRLRLGEFPALAAITGAQPAGTWSLAFADVRAGLQGAVSDIGVEGTPSDAVGEPRVLALNDPRAVLPARVSIDSRGLFAIAWPSAGADRAAVWDLRSGRAIASFRVTPSTRFVGFANGGREALLIDGVTLAAFRLGDGVAVRREVFERPVSDAWLSPNGRWLAALQAERDAALYLFDLRDDRRVAMLGAGISHELVRVSDDGNWIATADADRVVRLWRTADSRLEATLAVNATVADLSFAPGARRLLVLPAAGGMLSWQFGDGGEPERWSNDATWSYAHDPQTGLSMVGSSRDGYRVHDFNGGRDRSLPVLSFADSDEVAALLRARDNLSVIAAPSSGRATLWLPRLAALPVGTSRVRRAWLSGDGRAFAFADERDSFTVLPLDAGPGALAALEDDVATVAHSTIPALVRFSRDGRFAVSIEPSGLFRVRTIADGRFFDFIGRGGSDVIDADFSADGDQFLLLREQALEVYATASGRLLRREYRQSALSAMTSLDGVAGWLIGDIEGRLFLQTTVSHVDSPGLEQRSIGIPPSSDLLAVAGNNLLASVAGATLSVVDLERRAALGRPLTFASPVSALRFSSDRRHLVVRAGPWLHRVHVARSGLRITESRLLAPDMLSHDGFALQGHDAMGVQVLRGLDEPVPYTLWFDYRDQSPVAGTPPALRERWQLIDALRLRDGVSMVVE